MVSVPELIVFRLVFGFAPAHVSSFDHCSFERYERRSILVPDASQDTLRVVLTVKLSPLEILEDF